MANRNELEIRLIVKDEMSKSLKKAGKGADNFAKKTKKSFVDLAAKVFLLQKAFMAVTNAIGGFVAAASKVEGFRTRLNVLFKDVETGNQVFEDMSELAGKVPKTYDEILESATALAGVVKGGTQEINKLMPIIVDIASATGLSVVDTTSQMIRMYSAGAASADLFRERGISAALGFQAGVSVSAEETINRIVEQWEDGTGKFVGGAAALAETWEGTMSMLADSWFKFQANLGEFITKNPEVLSIIDNITFALGFWADQLERITTVDFADTALQGMVEQLEMVDATIKRMRESLEGFQVSTQAHSVILEKLNRLNLEKARLVDSIHKQQEKGIVVQQKLGKMEDAHIVEYNKHLEKRKKIESDLKKDAIADTRDMLKQMAADHRSAAVALKVIEIGEATMATHRAYTQALPNIPLALLVAALGAARIAMIAAQGFAEGTDSVPANLTPGEMVIPRSFADAVRSGAITIGGSEDGSGRAVVIENININGSVDNNNIEELAEALGFEIEQQLRNSRSI